MMLTRYWQVWKWGLAGVLSLGAIVAIFSWQYRSSQYLGIASERSAGLSAVGYTGEIIPPPAISFAAAQTLEQDPAGPMIMRTVSLRLKSPKVDNIRSKIDDVIRESNGYIDMLTIQSDAGDVHSLLATLRVPADQLQSAIGKLKTLGTLMEESETTQDTTAGYTDLVARLSNARRTEQRLLGLLSERAGKLGEIVQVEKEIGELRERIERMEGQQRRIQNHVRFAAVKLELTEANQAEFAGVRSRIRTALIDGYRAAIAHTVAVAVAALRYGPTVLFYSFLLLPLIVVVYRRFAFARKIA